jgi:flagellar hook-associated protein 2
VNVSSLATQARAVGSGLASLSVTAGVNDQLDVTLDGTTATVTIGAGNYGSAAALAAEVQSRINGVAAFSSNSSSVTLSASSGVFTATSARYGSASNIAFGGSAATALFGPAPTSTVGTDVAGTIDGIAATGSGQSLRAAGGTAAEGLSLQISGGALGARGTVTFSQGYASTLDSLLTNFMASDGVIAAKTTGMTRSIADVADRRTELSRRLATVEAHYRAQFGALDTMLSSMNATSTYLTQQLASLPKIGTSSA